MDPSFLAHDAMSFVHEFNEANPSRNRRALVSQEVWGLALRNLNGETLFSACKKEDISVDPLLAEALGVRWALQVATDQGL
ncbi:hypothetical protein TSUD_305850 [Trifolium subterraneum]|uniref:RNase H type-1 domain-containing protein n=1 Tax=Trifolium subterraneum TaxID=3900 RepID=A0A2Z6N261_TRISU|nr:hypothetical protein TSUD_305850 [Trifolium subterraneum]